MGSTPLLGGSGGMPLQDFKKFKCSEIDSGDF